MHTRSIDECDDDQDPFFFVGEYVLVTFKDDVWMDIVDVEVVAGVEERLGWTNGV